MQITRQTGAITGPGGFAMPAIDTNKLRMKAKIRTPRQIDRSIASPLPARLPGTPTVPTVRHFDGSDSYQAT